MSWRTTGTTWLIAIAVVAGAWWVRAQEIVVDDGGLPTRLFADNPLPVDDIDRIKVVRGGEPPLLFERDKDGWHQVEPFKVAADGYSIRKLLIAAADLEMSRRLSSDELPEGSDLAQLGLDPAAAVVELSAGEGFSTRIELGRRTVAGRAWIRLGEEDEILVVGDALHEQGLEDDPRNWRSRRLFPGASEVGSIQVLNGELDVRLVREGRRWIMESPLRTRADMEAVGRFIGVVDRVSHDGFIVDKPGSLDSFGFDPPAAKVSIDRDDGREVLLIGGPAGLVSKDRFAMIEGVPTVTKLGEAKLRGLLPQVVSFIDPMPSGARRGDVKSMEIVAPDGSSVFLDRDLEDWKIELQLNSTEESIAGYADPDKVDALLAILTETRAPDVVVQAFPAEMAVANVTFMGWDGRPIDTVRIAREPEAGRWALENGDGVLRIMPASTVMTLGPETWKVNELKP